SCNTCQLSFFELISLSFEAKNSTIVLYLDMCKAFDRVPHERLLYKLPTFGIQDPLLSWFRSFLSSRTQRTSVGESLSDYVPIVSGVVQGSVLGPAFFLVYINDLIPCFRHGTPFLFADDCKVVYSIRKSELEYQLTLINADIKRLEKWCQMWQMKFNPKKSQLLLLRCAVPQQVLRLHNTDIPIAQSVRDLGLRYSPSFNFSEQISHAVISGSRLSFLILRHILTTEARIALFKSHLRPLLEYGSIVLSYAQKRDLILIESVQRRFTKILLPNKQLTYRERCIYLKLDPLWFRRLVLNLCFLFTVIFEKPSSLGAHLPLRQPNNLRAEGILLNFPRSKSSFRENSFLVRYGRIWNILPSKTRTSLSLMIFRHNLREALSTNLLKMIAGPYITLDKLYEEGLPHI
ncbi:MAG: reverse transcriptase domain-containing protein, partial [Aeromonas sp.]